MKARSAAQKAAQRKASLASAAARSTRKAGRPAKQLRAWKTRKRGAPTSLSVKAGNLRFGAQHKWDKPSLSDLIAGKQKPGWSNKRRA